MRYKTSVFSRTPREEQYGNQSSLLQRGENCLLSQSPTTPSVSTIDSLAESSPIRLCFGTITAHARRDARERGGSDAAAVDARRGRVGLIRESRS